MILINWYIKNIYILEGDGTVFDVKVNTLLAVIETGSYTKAAQKLNLTQPRNVWN